MVHPPRGIVGRACRLGSGDLLVRVEGRCGPGRGGGPGAGPGLQIATATNDRGGAPAVRLSVEDSGTDMPPEVIERAFEPFFTTEASGKGKGLGLATVYGMVTGLGGDLTIDSQVGKDTAFNIVLPISRAEVDVREGGGGGAGDHPVIEDDEAVRAPSVAHRLRRILRSSWWHTLT